MDNVNIGVIEFDSNSKSTTWSDWLGITASIGCAIHCAAMPFVIAYLPALGLSFLADEAFHKWMALACFLIAIAAFVPGLRKHKNLVPVSIGAVGLFFITFAAFGLAGDCCAACAASPESSALAVDGETAGCCEACDQCESACCDEEGADASGSGETIGESSSGWLATIAPWLTPVGGMVLVSAHLLNRRYGCLCGCCQPA